MSALSETIISFNSLRRNVSFFKTGMIAAGSVEASTAPRRSATDMVIPYCEKTGKKEKAYGKRKTERSNPTKESKSVGAIIFLNFEKTISSPPPKRIYTAEIVITVPIKTPLSVTECSTPWRESPIKIATRKGGKIVPSASSVASAERRRSPATSTTGSASPIPATYGASM